MTVLTMQHTTFFSFEVTHIFKTYTLSSKRVKHIFFIIIQQPNEKITS